MMFSLSGSIKYIAYHLYQNTTDMACVVYRFSI